MNLLELATSISQDLGNPDTPTVGVIQYWLRQNIFTVNNAINTSYSISQADGSVQLIASDGTITPGVGDQESAIIKKMYMVYFYDSRVRASLGAASFDPVLEVSENGAVVRLTNKNEIAKTYLQMKKEEQEELNRLVAFYRGNNATPRSVEGDDVQEQWYHGVSVSNTRIKLAT